MTPCRIIALSLLLAGPVLARPNTNLWPAVAHPTAGRRAWALDLADMLDRRIKSYREIAIPREPSDPLYPGTNYYGNGGDNLSTNRDPFTDGSWKDCSAGGVFEMRSVREWVARTRDADLYRLLYDLMLSRYPARLAVNDTLPAAIQRNTGVLNLNSMFAGQFMFYPQPIAYGSTNVNRQTILAGLNDINPLAAGGDYGWIGGPYGVPYWVTSNEWFNAGWCFYALDLPQVYGIARPEYKGGTLETSLLGGYSDPFQLTQYVVADDDSRRNWNYFPARGHAHVSAARRLRSLNWYEAQREGIPYTDDGSTEWDLRVEGRASHSADPRYLWWRMLYTNAMREVEVGYDEFGYVYASHAASPANRTDSPAGWDRLHDVLCNMSLLAVVPRFIYMPATNGFVHTNLYDPGILYRTEPQSSTCSTDGVWSYPATFPTYTLSYGLSRKDAVEGTDTCARAILLTDLDEYLKYSVPSAGLTHKKPHNNPVNPELVTTTQRRWFPRYEAARPCWGMDRQSGPDVSTDTNGVSANIFSISLPHAASSTNWPCVGITSSGEYYPYNTQSLHSVSKNRIWFSVYPAGVNDGVLESKFTLGKWKLGMQHARIDAVGVQLCHPGSDDPDDSQKKLFATSFDPSVTWTHGLDGWQVVTDDDMQNPVTGYWLTNDCGGYRHELSFSNSSWVAMSVSNNIVDLECGLWSMEVAYTNTGLFYAHTVFLVGYMDLSFRNAYIVDPWDDSLAQSGSWEFPETITNAAFRYVRDSGAE